MSIKPPPPLSPFSALPSDAPVTGVDLPEPAHVRPIKPVPRPNLPRTGVNARELAKMLGRAAREGASPIVMAVPDVSDSLTLDPTGEVEVVEEGAPQPGPPPAFAAPPPALPATAFDAEAARVRVSGEAAPAPALVARVQIVPALPIAAGGSSGSANQPAALLSPASSPVAIVAAQPAIPSRFPAPPPRRTMSAAEALERARAAESSAAPAPVATAPLQPVAVPASAAAPAAPPTAPAAAAASSRGRANPGETTRPRPRKPVTEAPAAPPGTPGRAMASAPPPRRVLTAAEALAAARVAEPAATATVTTPVVVAPAQPSTPAVPPAPPAAPPAAAAPLPRVSTPRTSGMPSPVRAAQALLGVLVPESQLYVAAAVMVGDTTLLRPLWKSHRARLASTHAVEHAFAAAAIVTALSARAEALCFALVVADDRELLVAVDLEERSLVAVLPDARAWGVTLEA